MPEPSLYGGWHIIIQTHYTSYIHVGTAQLVLFSFHHITAYHTTHLEPRIAPATSASALACPHGHRACPGTCRTAAHASTATCQHKQVVVLHQHWLQAHVVGCILVGQASQLAGCLAGALGWPM